VAGTGTSLASKRVTGSVRWYSFSCYFQQTGMEVQDLERRKLYRENKSKSLSLLLSTRHFPSHVSLALAFETVNRKGRKCIVCPRAFLSLFPSSKALCRTDTNSGTALKVPDNPCPDHLAPAYFHTITSLSHRQAPKARERPSSMRLLIPFGSRGTGRGSESS